MQQFIVAHREAIEFATNIYASRQKGLGQAGIISAIARASYYVPHVKLRRFAHVLQTGMTEVRDEQSVIILRNWIMARIASSKMGSGFSDVVYAKTERAILAYVNNEPVSSIYTPKDELFPLPETDAGERFLVMEKAHEMIEQPIIPDDLRHLSLEELARSLDSGDSDVQCLTGNNASGLPDETSTLNLLEEKKVGDDATAPGEEKLSRRKVLMSLRVSRLTTSRSEIEKRFPLPLLSFPVFFRQSR